MKYGKFTMVAAFVLSMSIATTAYAEDAIPHQDFGMTSLNPRNDSIADWRLTDRVPACDARFSAAMQTSDPRPEYGVDLANGRPVAKTAFSVVCGKFSVGVHNSAMLSTEKGFGGRSPANETGLVLGFEDTARVPVVGTVAYLASITYLASDLGQGTSTMRDDYVELYAKAAVPIRVSERWTVSPSIAADKYVPVGHNNPLYWLEACLSARGTNIRGLGVLIDLCDKRAIVSITAVPQDEVRVARFALIKTIDDRDLSFTGGVQFTQHVKDGAGLIQSIARDGKLIEYEIPGAGGSKDKPLMWFIEATRTF